MVDQIVLILNSLQWVFSLIVSWWWIWLPLMLLLIFLELTEHFHKTLYLTGLKWVLIEIRVPQEAHKSLKAMEQIFAALHSIGGPKEPKNLKDKYNAWKDRVIGGKIRDWMSLEIVSIGGEIHYYVRCQESQKDLVQAQIYAHYPDSELTPVADYLAQLPASLPSSEIDISGAELELTKDSAFPIKTYIEFEEQGAGKDDLRRIDPLAPLAESLAAISFGEYLGVQVLVRATGDEWIKKGQAVIDKMLDKPEKPRNNALDQTLDSIESAVGGIFGGGGEEKKEEKKEAKKFSELSPGTQDVIKAIERGWSKLAFETAVRILYAAPKDRFNTGRVGTVLAVFKQFSTQALNGFKAGFQPEVKKGRRKEEKTSQNKEELYVSYRTRKFPDKSFVLNTEELTTVFHFPDIGVRTPSLPRVEAKKGEAPSGLPTV